MLFITCPCDIQIRRNINKTLDWAVSLGGKLSKKGERARDAEDALSWCRILAPKDFKGRRKIPAIPCVTDIGAQYSALQAILHLSESEPV